MRLPPGLCPGPRWGAYIAPRPPAGKGWVEGQSRIFIRFPAVPRNQQMSRIFSKMVLLFFPLPIRPYSTCLPRNATKWRTSNKDRQRSVQNSHADRPLIINTLYTYRSVRQMPSILHARQPSPTTVYFFNAATPASSVNTATVVFTATLEYNTTHSTVLLLSEEASWLLWMWIACVYHSAVSFPGKHVHRWICYRI